MRFKTDECQKIAIDFMVVIATPQNTVDLLFDSFTQTEQLQHNINTKTCSFYNIFGNSHFNRIQQIDCQFALMASKVANLKIDKLYQ